jgi:hypothetical protein
MLIRYASEERVPATEHPKFETPALGGVAAAFHRRGKAIRHHGEFSVTHEIEGDNERLNADYSGLSKLHLRLSVWDTGDWWFLACQPRPGPSGGWLFKHELRGELGRRPAEALVKAFEDSMLVGYWSADEQSAKLQEVWQVSRRPAEA